MHKQRLEAFSDGVLAILCTLLVLDIHGPNLSNVTTWSQFNRLMSPLTPQILTFVLSFLTIIGFWVNHTIFFSEIKEVTWSTLILNSLFLLSLSFLPLSTSILGKAINSQFAIFVYVLNLFIVAIVFGLLTRNSLKNNNTDKEIKVLGINLDENFIFLIIFYLVIFVLILLNLTQLSIIILCVGSAFFLFSPNTRAKIYNIISK